MSRPPHPKRDEAVAMMRAGKTYDAVSAETGINRSTLVTMRRNAGLPPRPLGPGPQKRRTWKTPPELEAKVAALRAEGLTIPEVARALRVDAKKVSSLLKEPSIQVDVARRRALAKDVASAALPVITSKGYELAEKMLENEDAKSFDATMRGLHAAEKIGSSVSGEDRKFNVEHSGAVETTAPQSAIEQLNVLIGLVCGPAGQPQSVTTGPARGTALPGR